MTQLITVPETGIDLAQAYDVLASVPAENLWLANFNSANTRSNYRRTVVNFIATMGIDSPQALYGISQGHIIAYRDHLKAKGYANTYVGNRLATLSSLYKFLADKQLCALNPVSGVMRPNTGAGGLGSGKTPALTPQDARAMLDAPDAETLIGLRDRAILHFFFFTGGRCSEPAALKVKNFRMDREYWVLETLGKGDKPNTIAINVECQIAIRRYLDAAGHGEDRNAPLFQAVKHGQNTGGPLSRQQFYRIFKRYAVAVGLPSDIPPHSARATFITQSLENGVPVRDVQATVNHSSVITTESYAHTQRRHRNSASLKVHY